MIGFAGHRLDVQGDGTNAWVTVNYDLTNHPVEMNTNDSISFTIQDDLSALLLFRGSLRAIVVSQR